MPVPEKCVAVNGIVGQQHRAGGERILIEQDAVVAPGRGDPLPLTVTEPFTNETTIPISLPVPPVRSIVLPETVEPSARLAAVDSQARRWPESFAASEVIVRDGQQRGRKTIASMPPAECMMTL